ncbi:MAG: CHAP domain-containing protein [Actinomycetales bacterium]|nr:CHAP domain-containing protein [Actinomycetales bacterium]
MSNKATDTAKSVGAQATVFLVKMVAGIGATAAGGIALAIAVGGLIVLALFGVMASILGGFGASAETVYAQCATSADATCGGRIIQSADGTWGFTTGEADGAWSQVTPAVGDNDYPWHDLGRKYMCNDTSSCLVDPLGYFVGECVSFVGWRLNRDAGVITPTFPLRGWGNAYQWLGVWQANGWKTSHTPIPGSVAYWGAGTGQSGVNGHVAYVKAVSVVNDDVLLEEYNFGPRHTYHTRWVPASYVGMFLYPPPIG